MGFATSQPHLPVQARALQGFAVRGPSLGLRIQSEALLSSLYSTRLLQAIDISMSKGCPHPCALFVFHHDNEFAGVWAVASDAAGGGSAIYQTKTVSPGSPKGKKHGSLCRLLPPPSNSLQRMCTSSTHAPPPILPPLLHPLPTVSSLLSRGRVIHSKLCLSAGSDQDGGVELSGGKPMDKEGGRRGGNTKEGGLTVVLRVLEKRKEEKNPPFKFFWHSVLFL